MNRHDRRTAAATARRSGYHHRIERLADALDHGPGDVFSVNIVHAPDCPLPRGLGPCRCHPEIFSRNTKTNAVVEVDEDGRVTAQSKVS